MITAASVSVAGEEQLLVFWQLGSGSAPISHSWEIQEQMVLNRNRMPCPTIK